MLIIPAIDIMDGKCVRLTQGNFSLAKKYYSSPVQMAKKFTQAGANRIHIVDLDGAKFGKPTNFALIKKIRQTNSAILEVGGGIRNLKTAKTYFIQTLKIYLNIVV